MPPAQVSTQPGRRLLLGCVALFTLPFFAAGVGILASGIRELRGGRENALPELLAGTLFTAISVAVFALAAAAVRGAARSAALIQQHPDRPWLWRPEWSERRIPDRGGTQTVVLWVFALFWNAVTAPLALVVVRAWSEGDHAVAFALIFPAAGVILLVAAIYGTLRRRKFGRSLCLIDQLPITPGGRCSGAVALRGEPVSESHFTLRLTCVHRVTTGSGKNRSTKETVLSQAEQRVAAAAAMRTEDGLRVPFHFDLAPDAQSSDLRNPSDLILWRLDAAAELPGVDYASSFELPVFATSSSAASDSDIVSYHAEQRQEAAGRALTSESRIEITPLADGGVEIFVPPRRDAAAIGLFILFLGIWTAAIAIMLRFDAPRVFPAIFIPIELLLIYGGLDFTLGRSLVRAHRTGIEYRRSWTGGGEPRHIDPGEIVSVDAEISGQSGNRAMWDVQVKREGVRKRTVIRYLRSGEDAEALAARIWQALGREWRPTTPTDTPASARS
jgi:hypothetical protein